MAPPNRILRPDDIQGQLDDFARRIAALETAPSLSYSSIKGGALLVRDANNVQRARLGLLGDGVTYGLEVDDATGAPLMDSMGLIAVMKPLGSNLSSPNYVATASFVALSGSAITFSLARAGQIGAWFAATCTYGGTSTVLEGTITLHVDGTPNALGVMYPPTPNFNYDTRGMLLGPLAVGAGSHTVDIRALNQGIPATSTFTVLSYLITVFQWGG